MAKFYMPPMFTALLDSKERLSLFWNRKGQNSQVERSLWSIVKLSGHQNAEKIGQNKQVY